MENSSSESGKESQESNLGECCTLSNPEKGQGLVSEAKNFMTDKSGSDHKEDAEVESFHFDHGDLDNGFENFKYLLSGEETDSQDLLNVDPETKPSLEALLEALSGIEKCYADPKVLRKLTSSVSCALDEAAAALSHMLAEVAGNLEQGEVRYLAEACSAGNAGGFLMVADMELGASTPLMEAAQEGRLELVKYFLTANANVHACTQTGDTALTYACENGHTDVADLLLQAGADLEHESEGGHTPLMKAAQKGHVCTVQVLINRGADVNRQTTNNDHTPLSLACAGGHLAVVKLLLSHAADLTHQLKDNSTMLMEASKGGHTAVVQLLLDYPNNLISTSIPPEISQLSTPTFEAVVESIT